MSGRSCGWCGEPLPPGSAPNRRYCPPPGPCKRLRDQRTTQLPKDRARLESERARYEQWFRRDGTENWARFIEGIDARLAALDAEEVRLR